MTFVASKIKKLKPVSFAFVCAAAAAVVFGLLAVAAHILALPESLAAIGALFTLIGLVVFRTQLLKNRP